MPSQNNILDLYQKSFQTMTVITPVAKSALTGLKTELVKKGEVTNATAKMLC